MKKPDIKTCHLTSRVSSYKFNIEGDKLFIKGFGNLDLELEPINIKDINLESINLK